MIRRCEVELVLRAIRRSGVADDVEKILVPHHTGRPRELSAEVFFLGGVLVAMKGRTLTLDNIHRALTQWIPISVQNALGTRVKATPGEVSEAIEVHQVRYLFSAIERRLEFTPKRVPDLSDVEREIRSDALQSIIDKLLAASLPKSLPKNISIAWDGSGVESWGKPKWPATATSNVADADLDEVSKAVAAVGAVVTTEGAKEKKSGAKKVTEVTSFDPDAHLGYRTKTHDNKSNKLFGYELFAGVAVLPVGADPDEMAKLLIALTLRPAAGDTSAPTLEVIDRLMDHGYTINEILADRGFSYKVPEDWSTQLHARGIEQVQDIHPQDHGVRDHDGIRIVDGWPHCPNMPLELATLERPQRYKVAPLKVGATKEERLNFERSTQELEEFHAHIALRRVFAFEFHENNPTLKDPGNTRWMCPAQAGKLKCALCPLSDAREYDDKPVVENPGSADTAPKCCRQATVSIPGPALAKLRQREYWGSPEWIESYLRRNHIEGIFGNLRNQSTQSIKRGFCRVVGLVKTSLMLTFEAVAANIRLVRQWAKRTGFTDDPLCAVHSSDYGFEELDESGQISLSGPFFFDDPPGDFAG